VTVTQAVDLHRQATLAYEPVGMGKAACVLSDEVSVTFSWPIRISRMIALPDASTAIAGQCWSPICLVSQPTILDSTL
jgi:hypothetical protein